MNLSVVDLFTVGIGLQYPHQSLEQAARITLTASPPRCRYYPKDKAAKRDKEALARATLYLFDQEHRVLAHRDADGHIEGFTIVNQDCHTVNLGTTRPLSQILASSKTKSGPELS